MIVEYKKAKVFYTDQGTGPEVILLHGFLENSTMWDNLIPAMMKSHRLIAIDLLGHGQTESLGYIHTMEMMAECVEYVLDHLKIERATIIGHSMGGYVALAFAERCPNRLNGLCLLNSTPLPDSEERKQNRDRAVKAVKQNKSAFVGMSVANLFAPKNRERLKREIEQVKMEALKIPLQGIIAALEGMKVRKDRSLVLNEFPSKKAMVIGRKDPVLDHATLLHLAERSGAEILELPNGHMSHIENFKELSYFLKQFIEK